MTSFILDQITDALDAGGTATLGDTVQITETGVGSLPSCFHVADLAVSSLCAASIELAAVTGAKHVQLDRRLAQMWFDMTLRPTGWKIPSAWDPIAGNYQTKDGWIRLHTNAPHHRDAAISVLGCPADRASVEEAVLSWDKGALETAIVEAKGAAAAMMSMDEWAAHPQGQSLAKEPLIAWDRVGSGAVPRALQGAQILDLTRVLAGPVATRFLAGFGADVLRIDPPTWDEPGIVPEVTLGKRCAGLDLRVAEDRAQFETLLERADILVHGYRPGALEGLGYGPQMRRDFNPHLIEVSLNAYGWTGPWARRRGFDSLVQMSAGLAHEGMIRAGSNAPVPLPVQALDHATGYLMAAAVLRALHLRNQTGEVATARVSLARTAALLTSAGYQATCSSLAPETTRDLTPESTFWGPARRVTFPVTLDSAGPIWPYSSGPLLGECRLS